MKSSDFAEVDFHSLFSPCFLLGLAHEVIDVSSDSDGLENDSDRELINTLLERHRNRIQASTSISTRMSATSPTSDDSNAKRDYEYADNKFITEPKISFTPSTESKAEPQMGQEAEPTFNSGAEALTSARSDDDLFDKGLLCPTPITSVASLVSTSSSAISITSLPTCCSIVQKATRLRIQRRSILSILLCPLCHLQGRASVPAPPVP